MYKRSSKLIFNPLLEFYKRQQFQFVINKRLNFKTMSSSLSSIPVEIDSIESLEKFPVYENLKLKFEKAEKNNDLVNSKSESEYLTDDKSGMKYELKIVNALSLRPINRPTEPGTKEIETKEKKDKVKSKNPFIKPEPELTIVDSLCNDYRVILNKYPNTEEHFLLVTKEFIQQDTLLKPIELQIVYTILKNINVSSSSNNIESEKVNFFAFFNSGPESGYSQFHKHIQFMKLPENFNIYQDEVIKGHEHYIPNDLNDSKQPLSEKNFKFRHFILPLPIDFKNNDEFEEILSTMYITLIRRVMNVFKEYEEIDKEFKFTGKISYNFLMTNKWMMIIPRRNAKFNGIWQNSLGYMGLFSVKNDEVKKNLLDTGISNLLENCGFPLQENEEESKIVYNEYSY